MTFVHDSPLKHHAARTSDGRAVAGPSLGIDCGIVSPSAFAVLRLRTNSNFAGLLNRQFSRLGTLQDAVDAPTCTRGINTSLPTAVMKDRSARLENRILRATHRRVW